MYERVLFIEDQRKKKVFWKGYPFYTSPTQGMQNGTKRLAYADN